MRRFEFVKTGGRPRVIRVVAVGALLVVTLAGVDAGPPPEPSRQSSSAGTAGSTPTLEVTVTEGTSMSVAASPDGRTLAIDLQGSIWVLPATGGRATRITDPFDDARQPVWSPDGRSVAYFAYREGTYDLWAINPDGTNQRQLTSGPADDREPMWSHDGTRIAFSSDRGEVFGSNYNIWILDVASGSVQQLTSDRSEDYMPAWSPGDEEVAFASTREGGRSVWAVKVTDGSERRLSQDEGRVDGPSWSPGGDIVYHLSTPESVRLMRAGQPLTESENVFAFRPSWTAAGELFYVSDGKIRRRDRRGRNRQTIEFSAVLEVTRPQYSRRKRDLDSREPRRVLGIVHPAISPDGTQVAFAALGDIYVMKIGGAPENITNDAALDTDPAWSPDGDRLVYSSDKGGSAMQLWVRDTRTGEPSQLTKGAAPAVAAAWSPDGTRIAFLTADGGPFRRAGISVVTVATGAVRQVHGVLPGPGTPTWSPDGNRVAVSMVAPNSTRYREGTNQVLTISLQDGSTRWHAPDPSLSIDSREGCGPVWSPDGTRMAAVYDGVLAVWPVGPTGEPAGEPRRVTAEMAHAPSWTGDSRQILYQSRDRLRLVDVETGRTRDVPIDLTYTPAVPTSRLVIHAGRLLDMKDGTPRSNIDIVVEGNRIRSVEPHAQGLHAGGDVLDASGLTVMPGFIEFHAHLEKDLGEAHGRALLAFGITTVRTAASTPYEAVEDREAIDAGVRAGPRNYGTGYLLEWRRNFHKMSVAVASPAHLDMELQRASVLQHDLIKSYVRMPDAQQRRLVEFAHRIGVPVTTHEIYPAALVGVDGTEHIAGTSRRGYSPKVAGLQRSYEDVIQVMGKSGRVFCPTNYRPGLIELFSKEPALRTDRRFKLYPPWMQAQIAEQAAVTTVPNPAQAAGAARMIMDAHRAGALVVAGTDSHNGLNLHAEITGFVLAGMSPYEAMKTATVNAAAALHLDAGTIEPGKLADLVMIDGDPLVNVRAITRVKHVVSNGRPYRVDQLLAGTCARAGC